MQVLVLFLFTDPQQTAGCPAQSEAVGYGSAIAEMYLEKYVMAKPTCLLN